MNLEVQVRGSSKCARTWTEPDPGQTTPQDLHLCSLLTLASIQRVAITNPSMEKLFVQVLRNIETYMGLPGSLGLQDPPSFELDSNRYAVPRLLYTLLSSDNFATIVMADNQLTMILLFL